MPPRLWLVVLLLCGLLAAYHCLSLNCTGPGCRIRGDQDDRTGHEDHQDGPEVEHRQDEVTGRGKGKGGKGGKGGYGKMMMYMAAAAKGIILYVMVHGAALLAAKALIVAKVAMVIALAAALKKAGDSNDKVSYEIIKHPYNSYVQTHSSSVDYDQHGYGDTGYNYRRRRKVRRSDKSGRQSR